jgi:hypothetical protein
MKSRLVLVTMSTLTLVSTSGFAATVGTGTLNLSGTAVGTTGGIDFYLNSPGDQTATANLPTSGAFSSLMPTTPEKIQSLTSANGVTPGSSFDFVNWIQLTDGINLDAMSIPIPGFPACTASSPETTGYECLVNAASPVVLTKTDMGVAARFDIQGEAHFAGDPTDTPFVGLFTSPTTNFSTIADFENYFNAHGAIPAISYSASFTTTSLASVPEPPAIGLFGLSLIAASLCRSSNRRQSRT